MKRLLSLLGLSVLMLASGCTVSKSALDDAEKRINVLRSKGVPDSALSPATVMLYEARAERDRNEHSASRASADSMRYLIAQAEAAYTEQAKLLKIRIDSLAGVAAAAKKELTGIPKVRLDSMVSRADSFAGIGWILQTEQCLQNAVDLIPALKFNQARGLELKPRIPGEWVCTQIGTSEAHKEVNFKEVKTFDFHPDGKVIYTEKGDGVKAERLKLNYEFVSTGNYDLNGDTVMLFIDRFKRIREDSQTKKTENGKDHWEKNSEPPYDSAITDRSQDRYVAFSDLGTDFKQMKKY